MTIQCVPNSQERSEFALYASSAPDWANEVNGEATQQNISPTSIHKGSEMNTKYGRLYGWESQKHEVSYSWEEAVAERVLESWDQVTLLQVL